MPESPTDHPHPAALLPVGGDDLRQLAERCLASAGKDQGAFGALHDRLGPGLRAFFAKRLPGGAANAAMDDLMQRVWTGLWEALARGRYDPSRSAVTTFVYAIAAKTWLRHLRSSKAQRGSGNGTRGGGSEYDDAEALDLSDDPASEAVAADLLEAVRRCLRDGTGVMSDEERAIVLAAANGASDRALAQRLGLAASTVNAKKQSGLEKVRKYLARLGHRADSAERGAASRE